MIKLDIETFVDHLNIDLLYIHCWGQSRKVVGLGGEPLEHSPPLIQKILQEEHTQTNKAKKFL